MPEIGEVARVVHYIHKHLVGKTLSKVTAQVDENVYGKVGCSAEAFEKALTGKKVVDARQQGKYFWMIMSSPPHPLMHFGMAGWLKIKNEDTAYYKPQKPENNTEWPPKYWKFALETREQPVCEAAFVDFRRFSRIRLIDCAADRIRNLSPLVENGPDPVQDADILTEQWLTDKLKSKHVPVKALLLDQANLSGIGNWVGDEILYDAKVHPEQYSDTLREDQIAQLHKSIHYVCKFAVDNLADSSVFPEEWLFKHRWGKGKKDSATTLPNGKKFVFITVGGRTSCVVPSVQKKTGPVAGDAKAETADDAGEVDEQGTGKSKRGSKKLSTKAADNIKAEEGEEDKETKSKAPRGKKRAAKPDDGDSPAVNDEIGEHDVKKPAPKKRKPAEKTSDKKAKDVSPAVNNNEDADEAVEKPASKPKKSTGTTAGNGTEPKSRHNKTEAVESSGRRRSGRVTGKGM